jgi:hypothetical protein
LKSHHPGARAREERNTQMGCWHNVFNRDRYVQLVTRTGRAVRRLGKALVIASHIIGVPTAAIEVWLYIDPHIDPPAPNVAPAWVPPPRAQPSNPYA